jgi:hypothetical protein
MRKTPRPNDLRARMQRVASKPTTQRPGRARSVPVVERPRSRVPTRAEARDKQAPRSRLHTLLAWAQWELAVVPEQRWRWLMAVIRCDSEPAQRNTR